MKLLTGIAAHGHQLQVLGYVGEDVMVGCVVEQSVSPQGLLQGERDKGSKRLLGSSPP